MMDMKIEDVLDAYVSPNRDKIVLRAFDWESVKKYRAIMFHELENGPKQISTGQFFLPKEDVDGIKREIRAKLIESIQYYQIVGLESKILSADVLLLKDYQIKEES